MMLADADAPGAQHDEKTQLMSQSPKRLREDDSDNRGTHYLPSSHIETIKEMKNALVDYDERDKGDYEPAPKRNRVDKRDDDQADFYDDKPALPKNQLRRRSSRSPSRSRAGGRTQHYRSSRSPARGPVHHDMRSRSRSRTRSRSSDRYRNSSRTHRRDGSPRGRRGSNVRDERGPARHRQGDRPGGRSFPETAPRDVVRAKQDVTQEDKKRGQRLFGGLLANLRAPATGPRSAPGRGPAGPRGGRPAGVETTTEKPSLSDRQLPHPASSNAYVEDKVHTQEVDGKSTKRLSKLALLREIEQVRFDEKRIIALQANDIALAHHLKTKSKPQVQYRPKTITSKQDDVIKSQMRDAQRCAELEYSAFEIEKAKRLAALKLKASQEFGYMPEASRNRHATPQQTQQDDNAMEDAASSNTSMHNADSMIDEPPTTTTEATENAEAELVPPQAASSSVEMKDNEMEDLPEAAAESVDEANDGQMPQPEQSDDHHDDRDIMIETEEDAVIY